MATKTTKPTKPAARKSARKPGAAKRVVNVGLQWKLLIGFTLLFTIVFALAFYWFYTFASDTALRRIQDDLVSTLQGAAGAVDGDLLVALAADGQPNASGQAWLAVAIAEEDETPDAADLRAAAMADYSEATSNGFSDDPRYSELLDQLQVIHEIEPRAWPYLFVRGAGEREVNYVVDLWVRYDPTKATPFLFTRSSRRSYNGLSELTLRLDSNDQFTPYEDEWGQWVSAYMPVANARGESIGAIGIDFEADYVYEVQNAIRQRVVVAFTIAYGTLFFLVFLVSRALTRPIEALTKTANLIGEGEYAKGLKGLQVKGAVRDEISTLAEVFRVMATKIYEREKSLRKQVESLQIFVDESKRQKQVREIAETDFFQDLQAKARQMRERSKGS